MTGNGAVLDFCRSFSDGDGPHDLTARLSADTRVLRAADAAFGSQVPDQLYLQPSGNLFRRPIQNQFTRNHLPQLHVNGQKAPLGPQSRVPGSLIRLIRSVLRATAMASHL